MITIFTSNIDGGILQYAVQLLKELSELGKECCLFLPEQAKVTVPPGCKDKLHTYEKFKTLNRRDRRFSLLSQQMLETEPEIIWYAESTIVSAQVCMNLKGKAKQYITVHDPGQDHPTSDASWKQRLKKWIEHRMRAGSMKAADVIVLPSEESCRKYTVFDPKNKEKAVVFPLGALLPDCTALRPQEFSEFPQKEMPGISESSKNRKKEPGYYLFFGRIDKYKGIANLLRAYRSMPEKKRLPLVIAGKLAGKGEFSDEEKELMKDCQGLFLLERYIEDGEMLWLFEHALAAMLPYEEASQSGILPIAYSFGVPVIVSDLPGLTQFVEEGRTGYIGKNPEGLAAAMQKIPEADVNWNKNCRNYYQTHLDWKANLNRLLG